MIFIYKVIAAISLGLALAALGGCETTTTGGAVGANRSQLMLVSSEQFDQMAAQAYAKLQADASRKGTLNQDRAMLQIQSLLPDVMPLYEEARRRG